MSFCLPKACLTISSAGGVPYNEPGKPCVRLGDVVVGIEMKDHTGMIQFEYGRERLDGFRGTWNLKAPDIHLQRSALAIIRPFDGEESLERKAFRWHTQELLKRCPSDEYSWKRPDGAFEPLSGRYDTLPRLHGGLIASSSKVIQNALFRDDKVKEFQERGDILAFEMEGYAVAFRAQCLNIRGVCDYADESKNRMWQPYAAIVAAAFAKTVILGLPTSRSTSIVPIILPDLPGSTDLLQPLHARELPRNKMDARLRSIPESIPRIPVRFTFAEEPINPYNGEEKFLDNLSEGEFASKDGRSVFSEGSSISKDSQSPLLARRAKRARRAKSPGTAPQSTMHRRIRSLLSLSSGSDSEEDKREMALLRSDRRLRNYLEQCERDLELDYSMYLARTQERF